MNIFNRHYEELLHSEYEKWFEKISYDTFKRYFLEAANQEHRDFIVDAIEAHCVKIGFNAKVFMRQQCPFIQFRIRTVRVFDETDQIVKRLAVRQYRIPADNE